MRQVLNSEDISQLIGNRVLDVQVIQHPFNGTALTIIFENDVQEIIWSRQVEDQVQTLAIFYGADVKPQPAVTQPPLPPRPVQPAPVQQQAYYQPPQAPDADPYNDYAAMLAGSGLTAQQVAAIQDYQRRNAPQGAQVQATVPPDIYDPSFLTRMGLAPR